MTSDMGLGDDTGASGAAPVAEGATHLPSAVWINRPLPEGRGAARAAKAIAGLVVVLGFVALVATQIATEPLEVVPTAVAGTDAEAGGASGDRPAVSPSNRPAGYFPAQFDQRGFAEAEQPPTF